MFYGGKVSHFACSLQCSVSCFHANGTKEVVQWAMSCTYFHIFPVKDALVYVFFSLADSFRHGVTLCQQGRDG